MHPHHGTARILDKKLHGCDIVHMALEAPWLQRSLPGQFIMLRIPHAATLLLRRPISLCALTGKGVELLIKVRGTGTERIAEWPVGHSLDIIGPLGNGFQPPHGADAVLVAGGIGIAPLVCLARWLLDNRPDCKVRMLFGARSSAECDALTQFIPSACDLRIATEDGSHGVRGFVTDLLPADAGVRSGSVFYGCGPMPMLQALAGITRTTGSPCYVSLEAHMACGVGACLGCSVPAHTPEGPAYVRVCADGPVFEARQIFP